MSAAPLPSQRGKMHAARPEHSPRLRRVLLALTEASGGWMTSLELQTAAITVAVGTCVSELRQAGYPVECQQVGRVWRYRMLAGGVA